jgi:hypothetical protein
VGELKTRQLCAVKFKDVKPPQPYSGAVSPHAVSANLLTIPEAAAAIKSGQPVVIYFRTSAGGRGKGSRQAQACQRYETDAFSGVQKDVGRAAKFFAMLRVNVAGVSKNQHSVFNEESAPGIAVFDGKGKLTMLRPRASSAEMLATAMKNGLRFSGLKSNEITKGQMIIWEIMRLEDQKSTLPANSPAAKTAGERLKSAYER